MFRSRAFACVALMLALCACDRRAEDDDRVPSARDFPVANRPFSQVTGASFGSEVERDRMGEAAVVLNLAKVEPGMSVADIGAGGGYYTVHLAERVGPKGRVLAEDIDPQVTEMLGTRVMREGLENVSIKLGTGDDPSLPPKSFDRIFMVHMYHEVVEPYAFLWRLRPALRPGGMVIVVEVELLLLAARRPRSEISADVQVRISLLAPEINGPDGPATGVPLTHAWMEPA
ncbi:MAG: class I SAM-dependent methyltransferase [Novosphingobium sp.]